MNLIIVLSTDAAPVRQGLLAAKAAKIPVVEIGGQELDPQHLYTASYNENEFELGELMGKAIAKYVPNAQIGDLASTYNYSGVAREKGLRAGLGKSDHVVSYEQPDISSLETSSAKTATDMLTAHPNINAMFTVFDEMSVPAATVVHARGDKVKLFSVGATPTNLSLMKKGELFAAAGVNTPLTAVVALDQFMKHVKTGAAFTPDAKAIAQDGGLEYQIVTKPSQAAIYNNAKSLAPWLKKWAKEYPCK